MASVHLLSDSPRQTVEIGRKIGSQLRGGEILALSGPLGSGKTCLIKGIAAGAGAAETKAVNSPTFVIVNQYVGRLDIYHIDLYRIGSAYEFENIGFDDYCCPTSVVLIEWADKIRAALRQINYIRLTLAHTGPTQRSLHIENIPEYIDLAPAT